MLSQDLVWQHPIVAALGPNMALNIDTNIANFRRQNPSCNSKTHGNNSAIQYTSLSHAAADTKKSTSNVVFNPARMAIINTGSNAQQTIRNPL